jgi:hypothetical protein
MWAARNGHEEVYKALIGKGADAKAKEKVRSRHCVSTGERANDQRVLGTGLPDLGATGPIEVHIHFAPLPKPISHKADETCHIPEWKAAAS